MVDKKPVKKSIIGRTPIRQPGSGKTSQLGLTAYLEEVKKRAYQIFQQRGSAHGSDFEDWLKAEKEIKQKYGIK